MGPGPGCLGDRGFGPRRAAPLYRSRGGPACPLPAVRGCVRFGARPKVVASPCTGATRAPVHSPSWRAIACTVAPPHRRIRWPTVTPTEKKKKKKKYPRVYPPLKKKKKKKKKK